MIDHITGEDVITLNWGARCASCGCYMEVGTKAALVRSTTHTIKRERINARIYATDDCTDEGISMRRTLTSIKPITSVCHLQADGCGSRYTVKAIYHSTSKPIIVAAHSAEEALASVQSQHTKVGQPLPSCYIVYQGNIPVLTHVNRATRCGCARCARS